jgi:Na+-transporting NADH:ubiquinone oxidoreductase subunit NqrA
MLKFAKIIHGLMREHIIKPLVRSGEWPTIRKHFLEKNPTCAACGEKILLNVHHMQPFHEFPQLELDENNLITLCMKNLCHLEIGHGDSFKSFNPNVKKDAEEALTYPERKDKIIARAKINRK